MAYCIKCGKELVEGANYCYHCGHPVGAPLSGASGPANSPTPARAYGRPQPTPEELEELRTRRLSVGRAILCLLCPPAGIATTIVHYRTHRPRAGRQALILTIIGFAIWTALYIIGNINEASTMNEIYEDEFDWYEL